MASIGPVYPALGDTASVNPEDDNDWLTPTNIEAADGSEAQVTAATYDSPDITYRLRGSQFDFSALPADAVIDGIVVEINRRCFAGTAKDYRVQLGSSVNQIEGDNKADTVNNWPGTLTVKSYGGAADTWGKAWTRADLMGDFTVFVAAQATSANADIGVDYVRVTVYYTASTPKSGSDSGSGSDSVTVAAAIDGTAEAGTGGDSLTAGAGAPVLQTNDTFTAGSDTNLSTWPHDYQSQGGNWTYYSFGGGGATVLAASDDVRGTGTTNQNAYFKDNWGDRTDSESILTFKSGSGRMALIARWQSSGLHAYHVEVNPSTGAWVVEAYNYGSDAVIATLGSGNIGAGADIHVRLRVTGTSPTAVKARLWTGGTEPEAWDVDTTNSDSDLQKAGSNGLFFRGAATEGQIDDYAVYSPGTAGVDAIQARFTVTDAGTGAETASVDQGGVAKSGSDAGVGAESLTSIALTGTAEAGAGAESAVLAVLADTRSDSGAGAEALASVAPVPSAEAGVGAESMQRIEQVRTEAGTGAETAGIAPAASAEAGAGADTASLAVLLPTRTDAGVGAETGTTGTPIGTSDAGVGADALASVANLTDARADAGAGADTATPAAAYTSTEAGSGAEAGAVGIGAADAALGTESATVDQGTTQKAASDAGAGAEIASLAAALASTDAGVGAETGGTGFPVAGVDSGIGSDVAAAPAAAFALNDAGAGQDSGTLAAAPPVRTEAAVGADGNAQVGIEVTYVNASDGGTGAETATIAALYAASESGVGAELAALSAGYVATDSGVGTEASRAIDRALDTRTDAGAGADVAAMAALLVALDAAAGTEALAGRALTLVDSGVGDDAGRLVGRNRGSSGARDRGTISSRDRGLTAPR